MESEVKEEGLTQKLSAAFSSLFDSSEEEEPIDDLPAIHDGAPKEKPRTIFDSFSSSISNKVNELRRSTSSSNSSSPQTEDSSETVSPSQTIERKSSPGFFSRLLDRFDVANKSTSTVESRKIGETSEDEVKTGSSHQAATSELVSAASESSIPRNVTLTHS